MAVVEKKRALRKDIAGFKRLMTQETKHAESMLCVEAIENTEVFSKSEIILAYWPLSDEIDLRPLILKWHPEKTFLLPQVVGEKLELRYFKGEDLLAPQGKYRIMEPRTEIFTIYDKVDLVLVPGLAFDHLGYRLGRGAGYYDKLLPKLYNAVKIGVGFSFQMVKEVPVEPHDEVLDIVIVPK
ncbi:5-formyltetrahydrofolate cyclo-ligase [Natronoflexus pectinivorans]|nr:5-formyltetrahydrofolate cyclo-ligase [Natronoflexus pectinivorans]